MGILDRIKKPFGKKTERIQTPKDIEADLPEDLVQFKRKDDDAIGFNPNNPELARESEEQGYLPPDFGLGQSRIERPLNKEQDTLVRDKVENRHKFELILSKLETIDTRLKVIEERMRR
jgi:hypothetical protein